MAAGHDDELKGTGLGPVVSSAHLAEALPALSEVELGLTMAGHAFQRWIVRCMTAAGGPGMPPLGVLIVHLVNYRGRPKTLTDIRLVLNLTDVHPASYAIRTLVEQGLVATGRRQGKEKIVAITLAAAALGARYAEARRALLAEAAERLGADEAEMSRLASLLRALSGVHDQAAHAAAAF